MGDGTGVKVAVGVGVGTGVLVAVGVGTGDGVGVGVRVGVSVKNTVGDGIRGVCVAGSAVGDGAGDGVGVGSSPLSHAINAANAPLNARTATKRMAWFIAISIRCYVLPSLQEYSIGIIGCRFDTFTIEERTRASTHPTDASSSWFVPYRI